MAFAHQGSSGQAAAVLSLQALLALDPHGARVQPRPELLLYMPAGFHAAVCKTLMQALQTPVAGLPAPGACTGGAGGASAVAAAGLLLANSEFKQAESAAHQAPAGAQESSAAAASQAQQPLQPSTGEQEDQQEQLEQLLQEEFAQLPPPHYLHAWSEGLFPAWYVWWHIGLLAYHQQQQQQQQQPTQSRQGQQEHLVRSQQQQEEQQPEGSWEQQQLGLRTRMAARAAKTGAGSKGCGKQQQEAAEQPSPPRSPGTPEPVNAPHAAAAASSGVSGSSSGGSGSSSGGSGSSSVPVNLQDLYGSPDARLFAVGYAARQISSGAQLQRLLNNPPLPYGLQHPVRHWILGLPRVWPCATCQRPAGEVPSGDQGEPCEHLMCCMECCAACCSGACLQKHTCSTEPATQVAHVRKWRLLDLLQPPAPTLTPAHTHDQQQPQHERYHQQQQEQAQEAASPSFSSSCWLPPASGAALPGILQQWLSTQQRAQGSSSDDCLFALHSNERAIAKLQLAAAAEARASPAAAAAGGNVVWIDTDSPNWAEDLARSLAGEDGDGAGRRLPPAAARQRRILARERMAQTEVQQRRRQWQEQMQQRPGA